VFCEIDAVICSSVLYHQWVKDVGAAVREIIRVLRPGGLFIVNVPAFRFLHSPHDEAVMTARRFTQDELRRILTDNGFVLGRLTYWTTLLFPLAVLARTIRGSQTGRDFQSTDKTFTHHLFTSIMRIELSLLRRFSLPFGVALVAVGRKPIHSGQPIDSSPNG
jgi:SAM-dependent methyltransferase